MGHETARRHRHGHGGSPHRQPEPAVADAPVMDVADADVGMAEARRRFGGVDIPATLAGALTALGLTVLVGGLLAAAGAFGYQLGLKDAPTKLSVGGLVGGLATLLGAFLVGGWVAGRVARYNGGVNGLLTAVWFVLLAALTAGLGAWLGDENNVFHDVHLPQWFSKNALGTAAVVGGVIALAIMLIAGWLGGRLGGRYHHRADAVVARTRPGAVAVPRQVVRAP